MQTTERAVAKNKLTILYALKSANIRLSEEQMIRMVNELELMDYFDIKLNLAELSENNLIDLINTLNGAFYKINDIGLSTLDVFINDLPFSLREKLDAYMNENRERLKLDGRLFGEYMQVGEGQYRVTLRVLDNNISTFEVSFFVASKEEADGFVKGWKKRAIDIYRKVVEMLMSVE